MEMIKVYYAPSFGTPPFPFPESGKLEFQNSYEFQSFLKQYICESCLMDERESENQAGWFSIGELLNSGCGCEIDIEDSEHLIDYEYVVDLRGKTNV